MKLSDVSPKERQVILFRKFWQDFNHFTWLTGHIDKRGFPPEVLDALCQVTFELATTCGAYRRLLESPEGPKLPDLSHVKPAVGLTYARRNQGSG